MPYAPAAEYQSLLGDESYRAYLDMLLRPVRRKPAACGPVLVLHASEDALIDATDAQATGAFYGAGVEVIEGLAHDLMLEPRWELVAQRVLKWLEENKASMGRRF